MQSKARSEPAKDGDIVFNGAVEYEQLFSILQSIWATYWYCTW